MKRDTYAIPEGQNGVGLTPAQLVAGSANRDNSWAGADILPSIEKLSAAATFSQELTPALRLFFDGLASRRTSVKRATPSVATLTVPRSNPFFVNPNPAASSTTVLYSFVGAQRPYK